MLLAIDAGNTNVVFAVFDGDRRVGMWRCKTDAARTADEYRVFLSTLFPAAGLEFSAITDTIISSVVPDANMNLRRLCENTFGCTARFVGAGDVTFNLKINLNKPEELGADRIVNAMAVLAHHRSPAIVVDFGTATTFDVINGKGEYCGGAICAGVNLSMQALHAAAAKLPKIGVNKPDSVIGRDTVGAMQSGVYWGYVSMVEGMIDRIAAELGETPFVIATGGLSVLFAGGTDKINVIDEELTLRGLVAIHQHNQKAKAA